MVKHFSNQADDKKSERIINDEEEVKTTIFEEARIGQNVHPAQFEKEKVMSNIDPDTMLKKQQNLEFVDLPEDGKHDDS